MHVRPVLVGVLWLVFALSLLSSPRGQAMPAASHPPLLVAASTVSQVSAVAASYALPAAHPQTPPSQPLPGPAPYSPYTWDNLSLNATGGDPGGLWGPVMAYDAADGYLVLFSGHNATYRNTNSTWTYSPKAVWTNITSTAGAAPPARALAGMAVDPGTGDLILFGGSENVGVGNDTWQFHAGKWTDLTPTLSRSPPPMTEMTFTTDATDGEILLYGDALGSPVADQTWVWKAGAWTNLTATAGAPPAGVIGAESSNDPMDGGVLVAGGETATGRPVNQTYLFRAGAWTNLTNLLLPAPTPTAEGALSYIPGNASLVLAFGHLTGQGDYENNYTWQWHAGKWTNISTRNGGAPYTRDGVAYSSYLNGTSVVYGGEDQYMGRERNIGGLWIVNTSLSVRGSFAPISLNVNQNATYSGSYVGGLPFGVVHSWSFGDTTGSSLLAGTKSYSAPGTYHAIFSTRTLGPQYAYLNWTVTVHALPLTLTATSNVTQTFVGRTVSFTASPHAGTPPYLVSWLFGDNTTGTGPAPTHTYSTQSNGSVYVAASDSLGQWAHALLTVSVWRLPVSPLTVTLSANSSTTTVGGSLVFIATPSGGSGGVTFSWEFGDNTTGTSNPVTHTFSSQSNGTVYVAVTDSAGSWAHASIAIQVHRVATSGSPSGPEHASSFPWLYVLVGLVAVAVVAALLVALYVRRRKGAKGATGPAPAGSSGPQAPPMGTEAAPATPPPQPPPAPAPLPPPPPDMVPGPAPSPPSPPPLPGPHPS